MCFKVVFLLFLFKMLIFFVFLVILGYGRLLFNIFSCLSLISCKLFKKVFFVLNGNFVFLGLKRDVVVLYGLISWFGYFNLWLFGEVGMYLCDLMRLLKFMLFVLC